MVAAYVLIQTEVGKAGQVADAIAEIKGCMRSTPWPGPTTSSPAPRRAA
jgi:hypothetical protein